MISRQLDDKYSFIMPSCASVHVVRLMKMFVFVFVFFSILLNVLSKTLNMLKA